MKQWSPPPLGGGGTQADQQRPEQLYATMIYSGCDPHDGNQTGWSWDAEAMAVKNLIADKQSIGGTLCLDAGEGRRGALELRPCDNTSAGQKFSAQRRHRGKVRLIANVTERGGTTRPMCVDANDWSGVAVFLAECTDLHFGSSQEFAIDSSTGLLSSLQSDFSGPTRRCIAALPNGFGGRFVRPPPDGDPRTLNEPNARRAKLLQLWEKPQPAGASAILLLNMRSGSAGSEMMRVDFAADLNLTGSFTVRDVYAHTDIDDNRPRRDLSVVVPARDSRMFVLRPAAR